MSWVYYADRKPTKEDGDSRGFVLSRYKDGGHSCITYNLETSAIAWMRLSDLPPLPKQKTRRAPTQADIDKATKPIPCWVCTYDESLWHKRILLGVSKFGPRRYVAWSGPDTCITAWEKCEIEVEE